jgi:hypothetical protein
MSQITETQLHAWMMDGNYPPHYHDGNHPAFCKKLDRRATATLNRDVEYRTEEKRKVITPRMRREGQTHREVTKTLRKGSRVKVVMASRMGDVGITPNLDAQNGYVVRINCVEGEWDMFGDGKQVIPLKPEGVLVDIHPIEDPDYERVALVFPEGSTPPHQYPAE